VLREQAPVWRDPITGMYNITRYEDLRKVLLDPDNFPSERPMTQASSTSRGPGRSGNSTREGVGAAPTLAGRDDPNHKQMRAMFDHAFRASKIKEMDPWVEALAYRLVDAFIDEGECDWFKSMALPLPLIVIGKQMGAPETSDIGRSRPGPTPGCSAWAYADEEEAICPPRWRSRPALLPEGLRPPEERAGRHPDLRDVNSVIPEWGRALTDEELHAEMMADTFVGGSETSTNAISAGIMLLGRDREAWETLKSDPDKYLRTFVEEVLRLESPVHALFRVARRDIEMHGVAIRRRANDQHPLCRREPRRRALPEPEKLDLTRRNSASHLAFGSGVHHCLGAPLARRELYWAFRAFLAGSRLRADAEPQPAAHAPNFALRALKELHITFRENHDRSGNRSGGAAARVSTG